MLQHTKVGDVAPSLVKAVTTVTGRVKAHLVLGAVFLASVQPAAVATTDATLRKTTGQLVPLPSVRHAPRCLR